MLVINVIRGVDKTGNAAAIEATPLEFVGQHHALSRLLCDGVGNLDLAATTRVGAPQYIEERGMYWDPSTSLVRA